MKTLFQFLASLLLCTTLNAQTNSVTLLTQVLSDQRTLSLIQSNLVSGNRETITINELESIGINSVVISQLRNQNINSFYVPYVESTIATFSTNFMIICLDNVTNENQLVNRRTNSLVTRSQISSNFTIMYKTQPHIYDANASITRTTIQTNGSLQTEILQLEGKWLPWRRCYCSRQSVHYDENGIPEINSMGRCNRYRQDRERCGTVCDKTGFTDQNCSNEHCPGC